MQIRDTRRADLSSVLAIHHAAFPDEDVAALVGEGLARLAAAGVGLVFVLGHPSYYPQLGFEPAGRLGLDAPYPIADENAAAWMVLALRTGIIGRVAGVARCADALHRPEYWLE